MPNIDNIRDKNDQELLEELTNINRGGIISNVISVNSILRKNMADKIPIIIKISEIKVTTPVAKLSFRDSKSDVSREVNIP